MNKDKQAKNEQKEDAKPSELETTKAQLVQTAENLLRLQAEFANFKRRSEEQQTKIYSNGVADTLKEFVNVFDDFELALKNSNNLEDFKKGVELIFAKLISTSEDLGLEKIQTVGEQFNPRLHEALLTEVSNEPEDTIIQELQSGYKVNDTVIRTAKVKVSRK